MAEVNSRLISEQLDEMALKIMMIEPGDLSVVGELVVLVEELGFVKDIGEYPNIAKMAKALEDVLGRIVMVELADSAENYELLGKAITCVQELYRKKDDDDAVIKDFYELLEKMGISSGGGSATVDIIPPAISPSTG